MGAPACGPETRVAAPTPGKPRGGSDAHAGEKRAHAAVGSVVVSQCACSHLTPVHVAIWKRLHGDPSLLQAAGATMDVAQLQRYMDQPAAQLDMATEVVQCLSCGFRGARERALPPQDTSDDDEDAEDDSFMAHAILQGHHIALMLRQRTLYCACCRDVVYADTACGVRRKRRVRSLAGPAMPKLLRRGLVNLGNTCFLSSVLQALAHNRMLQHYFFVARSHDTTICQQQRRRLLLKQQQQREEPGAAGEKAEQGRDAGVSVCLGCELAGFMAKLVAPPALQQQAWAAPPIAPQGILEAIWNAFPPFVGTDQHDAHELFIALLGGLHSHTHPRVFIHGGASPRFTPRGHSLCDCAVHQHFSGVLRSALVCSDCGSASHKFDPFLDVSLSLTDGKRLGTKGKPREAKRQDEKAQIASSTAERPELTLEGLLKRFTAEETMRGANQVYCKRCARYCTHHKSLSLHTLPNVLVLHVRRLDFYNHRKLSQTVRFPLLGLQMRPFTSADETGDDSNEGRALQSSSGGKSDDVYDLEAVVNHHGDSVLGGHYTTYVRDEPAVKADGGGDGGAQQPWILFDDDEVTSVAADEVQQSQAYILYYVRRRPVVAVGAGMPPSLSFPV